MPGLQYSRLHLKIYNKDQDKLHSHRNYYKKYLLSVNGSIEVNYSFLLLSLIFNFSSSHVLSFSLLQDLEVLSYLCCCSLNFLLMLVLTLLLKLVYLTLLLPLVV